MTEESARYAAARAKGVCTHNASQGIPLNDPARAAELTELGVTGEQVICTESCGKVFANAAEWRVAHKRAA